jgi:hypothetical protein
MNPVLQTLLARLPEAAKTERDLATTAFAIVDNFKAKAAEVMGDQDLSAVGKAAKIKAMASGSPLAHFKQIKAEAAKAATDISNLRQSVELKPPADTSPTAEMRRAELRAYVRSLPMNERLRFVQDNEDVAVAALDSLPALSGLSGEQFEVVKQSRVERLHGARIAGIESRAEIVDAVNAAVQIASRQFAEATGLTEAEIQ